MKTLYPVTVRARESLATLIPNCFELEHAVPGLPPGTGGVQMGMMLFSIAVSADAPVTAIRGPVQPYPKVLFVIAVPDAPSRETCGMVCGWAPFPSRLLLMTVPDDP